MPVYSPPGAPNIVYIGGAMQYDEILRRSRVERPRGPALGGRGRQLHGHDDRYPGREPAP